MLHKFSIKELRSKLKFNCNKKMYVIAAIVVTVIFSGFAPFFFGTDQLYSHLFYIPIAMSTLWMPQQLLV